MRRIELARIRSFRSPGFDELAVLVELRDSGVAVAVGDINVPRCIPRDVSGALENVALRARARRPATPSTSWWSLCARRRASSSRSAAAPSASCSGASARTTSATGTRAIQWRGRYAFGFRFSTQQHLNLSVGVEFYYHAGHLIHHPDVVLRIHAHLLRHQHRVGLLADLANEFS